MVYAAKIGMNAYSYVEKGDYGSNQISTLVLIMVISILCAFMDLLMLGAFVVTTYKFSKIIVVEKTRNTFLIKLFLFVVCLLIFLASTKKVWDHSYILYRNVNSSEIETKDCHLRGNEF